MDGVNRAIACLVAVALAVVASGCGLGERAALEDRITSAPSRADRSLVKGTITVESRFIEGPPPGTAIGVPAGAEDFEMPEGGFAIGAETVDFEMELGSSRAAFFQSGREQPFVLMDDLVLFGRREGVPADDARPWVRLDLEDIDTGAGEVNPFGENAAHALVAVPPPLITDLVAGSLTGSIEERGRDTVAGVDVTKYDVNVSIDKALGDKRHKRYPESRREKIDDLIELLGVDGNLQSAEVAIDDDGLLRRFSVTLTQHPATRVEFALVVTVEYESYGGTYSHDLPTPQEVLSVDTVVRFIGVVGADGGAA